MPTGVILKCTMMGKCNSANGLAEDKILTLITCLKRMQTHFHQTRKIACDKYNPRFYPKRKKNNVMGISGMSPQRSTGIGGLFSIIVNEAAHETTDD
jgi:coproporphyrinogen III oxidase